MPRYDFRTVRRLEQQYGKAISDLILRYLQIPFEASITQIRQALRDLAGNREFIEQAARMISSNMITQVNRSNAQSWQQAAEESSRGKIIYQSLREGIRGRVAERIREIVSENANLISSIPEALRRSINLHIAASQRAGLRPETIAKQLRKRLPQLTRSRARLIARTETAKAATALTRARAENLNLGWYIWSTSRDERVRKSHKKMEDVLVAWNDPPAPELLVGEKSEGHYHAGNIWNCRCDPQPVVDLDIIKWPHKVYRKGRISYMTRSAFANLAKRAA